MDQTGKMITQWLCIIFVLQNTILNFFTIFSVIFMDLFYDNEVHTLARGPIISYSLMATLF